MDSVPGGCYNHGVAWSDFPDARNSVQLLQRSLARGRLGHAYLFTGSDPDLLERIARELAATVNCARSSAEGHQDAVLPSEACGVCSSCRRTRQGLHPDVQWVRAESKSRVIRVEQVRELIQSVQMKPSEARVKVGIIVSADRLMTAAANAFLKCLEEPPSRSLLILLSTEPERLLPTILSRCLRLSFPAADRIDEAEFPWLQKFATELSTPQKSRLGRYRVLDALLQRLAAARESAEEEVSARSPLREHKDVDPDLREQWEEEAKAATEAEYRRRREATLRLLQLWMRDVCLASLGQPESLFALPMLGYASSALGSRLPLEQAMANVQTLEEVQGLLRSTNVQEALALEVALLRLHA